MTSTHRTWILSLLALGLVAGCDSDGPTVDAGPSDGGDAGQVEVDALRVTTTIPLDGAAEVAPATSIRVAFSAQLDGESGRIEVTADDEPVALDGLVFSDDGREVRVTPSSPLPGNASVAVTVSGFRSGDLELAEPHVFSFSTSDPFAPTVVRATPEEGASGVSPELSAIELEMSERMNANLGALTLEGGPGAIGAPTWDGAKVSFSVSGLAPNTDYRVALIGFADPAGNALDGAPYLGDGVLDFTTGADTTAPRVTEATPSEGQTGLPPIRTTRVRIVFDEPMDPSAGTAELVHGASSTPLTASWAGGDTVLVLDLDGMLEADVDYRVTLDGFTDRAGNPLDGAPYLGDGALDFSTAGDDLPPFVVYTNPVEGQGGIRWTTNSVFVTFSEPMDESTTVVPFTDGVTTGTFTGTWSSGGTLLELDVAGKLISGRTYELDLTAFQDAPGTAPVDPLHPYLGDGHLRFTTDTPEGENCQDFLTQAEATVDGAVFTWDIARDQVVNVDGAAACDASGGSADAVVRYTKSTPESTDPGGAGHVLRVTVTSTSSLTNKDITVDVLRDGCDPTSSVRLTCGANARSHSFDLDVPAGEYFVWIAASTGEDFRGATVEIEEVPASLGDTCENAIPITVGTTSITPNGAQRLQAPSCIGDGALTWYRYTAGERLGLVTLDSARAVGARDAATGDPLLCRADAVTTPLPVIVEAGTEACIAVASGSPATIKIEEREYTGVRGVPTDLGVTYQSSFGGAHYAPFIGLTTSRIIVTGSSKVQHAPRTGGVVADEISYSGLPGQTGAAIGEVFYTVPTRNANLTEPAPMIYQLTDSTGAFLDAPMPVDTPTTPSPFVVSQRIAAMVVDGSDFLLVQGSSTTSGAAHFYTTPIAGGPITHLGTNNHLHSVSGMAADSTFIYLIARGFGGGQEAEGIYRLRRDELSNPDVTPVTVYLGGENHNDSGGGIFLDSTGGTSWLYFRTYSPAHVHLLIDPDTATPRYLGPLWTQARNNETGMGYDPAIPALYVIDHSNSDGWVRLD